MKNYLKIIFTLLIASASYTGAIAQVQEVVIQTSGKCLECKENIEKAVMSEKGVRFAELDMETKKVKVVFNPKRTNEEIIRQAISRKGYDADAVKADPAGIEKLSPCCRPGGHEE